MPEAGSLAWDNLILPGESAFPWRFLSLQADMHLGLCLEEGLSIGLLAQPLLGLTQKLMQVVLKGTCLPPILLLDIQFTPDVQLFETLFSEQRQKYYSIFPVIPQAEKENRYWA